MHRQLNGRFAFVLLVFLVAFSSCAPWKERTATTKNFDARETAKDVYHLLEENLPGGDKYNFAVAELEKAKREGPNESWVYIAESMSILTSDYTVGDRYEMKTYPEGTLDRAITYAKKAVEADGNESQAFAHLASLYIVKREFKKASQLLIVAEDIDASSFYPWFFRGVLQEKMKEFEQARGSLVEAEDRVERHYQRNLVNTCRQDIQALDGDVEEVERILKKNIEDNREISLPYGNYAYFLMKHGRYDESIAYWERVIRIDSYPEAYKQLDLVKRLKVQEVAFLDRNH